MIAMSNTNYDILVEIVNEVIGNGGPSGVFDTLQELNDRYPKGAKGVYLVTVNGKWYYWNGSEWVAGGVYQATQLADGSVTDVKLDIDLQHKINSIEGIGQKAEKANVDLASHKASSQAHNAAAITYSGQVQASDVKEAIDKTNARISNIVAQSGNDNTEIRDARGGFNVLGDRLNSTDEQLADIAITPQMFGAVGDNVTDDTQAINDAIAFAKAHNKTLSFPKVPDGYKTTDTITIDADIEVVMQSPIIYHGPADRPILVYGDQNIQITRKTSVLRAYKYYDWSMGYDVEWSSDDCKAVQIINVIESYIKVMEASNCTIGLELVGWDRAFSYSTIELGRVYNNKKGLHLVTKGTSGGFLTECKIYGGRISQFTLVNPTQSRYGITSKKQNEHVFDGIIFEKQCFELKQSSLDEGLEALPFNLEDMDTCLFVDFRIEGNSRTNMAKLTRCWQCEFRPLKVVTSSTEILDIEDSPKGANTNSNTINKSSIDIIRFDNLLEHMNYEYISRSTRRVLLKNMFNVLLNSSPFTMGNIRNFMQYTTDGPITNNGLMMKDSITVQNIAVGVNTSEHKVYQVSKNGIARLAVLCFDENDNYIVPTPASNLIKGGFLEYSASYYGGVYIQPQDGTNDYKEITFSVADSVKKIIVIIGGTNRANHLLSISVQAQYLSRPDRFTTASIWYPINTTFHNFPTMESAPTIGKHYVGEIVWSSGAEQTGWKCISVNSSGLGTWVAI